MQAKETSPKLSTISSRAENHCLPL